MIKVLVEAGLDINSLDARGNTPFYLAVLAKKVSSVHELLGLGADPNVRPEKRPAAVWMAVVQDERESIQSLIQYGAECELDDKLAMQLMDYALAFDIPEVVQISLEQCLTSDCSFRGHVPGTWVADYYNAELCKEVFLKDGTDLSKRPNWKFEKPSESFVESMTKEHLSVQYPKHLREKYGDLKVKIEMVIDPVGKVRFPKFLEPLPWDLRLFLRESIRSWTVDLPHSDELNTAYKVRLPIELKSKDFGVKVFEVGELDQAPVPVKRYAPVYPPELKKKWVQGFADVVFVVNEQGKVVDAKIEKSSHSEFGKNALSAVKQWEFKPGFMDGSPVKTRVRIPLSFTLKR
ncbi:TonB family protein [Opitutia bacterium ISCC 51]|nr:TonB family protein [Opitutae bacterium ISCC 51]QXD26956.1 TonB family protein [Opitutae bacterium ISCC 52]